MTRTQTSGTTKSINATKYEIIPTEKGYAYIISIALTTNLILLYAHVNALGLLYNDFLNDIGGGIAGFTLIMGVFNLFMSFSGILTNVALKKFTLRQVGFFGAFLYTFGWFFTAFVRSMPQIIVTYSFMQGVGNGVLFSISFASYNKYFVSQKKVTVLSICQLFVSSATIALPLLAEKMLNKYGYRGTILIFSAIIANCIFAIACMHPVEWHSEKRLLHKTINECNEIMLYETNKSSEIDVVKNVEDALLENSNNQKNKSRGKLTILTEFLDIALLKDILFINMMVGLAFGLMTDVFFFSIFPSHLYDLNFDSEEVATLLSFLGGSDLAGRAFLAVFSKYCNVRSEIIFYYAVLMSTIFKFFIFFCESYYAFLAITCILGFIRALIQCPYPLVYADYNPAKFPASIALGMLMCGSMSLPFMSLIGKLRELLGSHFTGYMILILSNFICLIPWTIKLWHFRTKRNPKK